MMLVTNIGLWWNLMIIDGWLRVLNNDVSSSWKDFRERLMSLLILITESNRRQLLRWPRNLKITKFLSNFLWISRLQTTRSCLSFHSFWRSTRFRNLSAEKVWWENFANLTFTQSKSNLLTSFTLIFLNDSKLLGLNLTSKRNYKFIAKV